MQDLNKHILVIDDNPAIHQDFRKILSPKKTSDAETAEAEAILFGNSHEASHEISFEVDSAYQGGEGLAKVQQALEAGCRYAVAFVDVRMPPGWDGIETIKHLWEADPFLEVVICTAYSDYSWADISETIGQSHNLVILKKPFDNIEVLQLAHTLTRKWALSMEVAQKLGRLDCQVNEQTQELQVTNAKLVSEMDERIQAQERLCLSEERFSKAFEFSPIPMAIYSLDNHRFTTVNESFVQTTGHSVPDIVDRGLDELPLLRDDQEQPALRAALAEGKPIRTLSCNVQHRSGEKRDVVVSAECFELSGEPHLLLALQDVTERLRLEAQLRQSQKMEALGQLAAGIAHDFNNIITVVHGYADLHLELGNLEPKVADSLSHIAEAANRATHLVRQLMTFSRRQANQPKVLDLNCLVHSLSDMLRRIIGEDIRLICDLQDVLPQLHADPCNLEQILINLAVNARDAMPGGGTLTIRTQAVALGADELLHNPEAAEGRHIRLSIEDDGCGMDAATLTRVFEPFFTTKSPGKGTGMGLATVHGIVKQHQGWIEVESESGKGTAFHIYLPATEEDETCLETSQTADHGLLRSPKRETILVVEDEKSLKNLLRASLRQLGYRTLVARDGSQALKIWERLDHRIDLLLTDLVMPGGISGRDLADTLRSRDEDLKVVYTTGYDIDHQELDVGCHSGISFMPKPFTPSVLAQTVREALEGLGRSGEGLNGHSRAPGCAVAKSRPD